MGVERTADGQHGRATARRAAQIDSEKIYQPVEAVRMVKEVGPQVRRDGRGPFQPRPRRPPRRPAAARHAHAPARHRQPGPRRRLRRGRQGPRGREAGADVVGTATWPSRSRSGFDDFDVAIATPDKMGTVGRLGRILGPRGKMPNPKSGTVTFDVGKAVADRRRASSSTAPTAARTCTRRSARRASTSSSSREYAALVEEIVRAKPAAAKGRYIRTSP